MEYQLKADDFVGVTFGLFMVLWLHQQHSSFLKLTVFQSIGQLL